MNAAALPQVFMRSVATRAQHASVSTSLRETLKRVGEESFDLVILETAGIGQSSSEIIDLSDVSLYVMTPEFGAPSQLEKIDMLDFADFVAVNKSDKRGAADAARYVAKQMQRNRARFDVPLDDMPVYSCISSQFGDDGLDELFHALCERFRPSDPERWLEPTKSARAEGCITVVPPNRVRYLSENQRCTQRVSSRDDGLCPSSRPTTIVEKHVEDC